MPVRCKAKKPKFALNLKQDFQLSDDQLLEVYTLPIQYSLYYHQLIQDIGLIKKMVWTQE